jgi:ribosomal protein L37AE/L43A
MGLYPFKGSTPLTGIVKYIKYSNLIKHLRWIKEMQACPSPFCPVDGTPDIDYIDYKGNGVWHCKYCGISFTMAKNIKNEKITL